MSSTLFVYYKIRSQEREELRLRAEMLSDQIRQLIPGINVILMRRPELSADGQETWMEIYSHLDGLTEEIKLTINAEAKLLKLPTSRAEEFFIPLK